MRIKTPVILFVGFAALMVGLIAFMNVLNLEPTDFEEADLKTAMLPYRLGFYILVLAAWKPIARFISRPRVHKDDRTPEMLERWDELTALLQKSWWKVGLFFALFELIAIQQIGAGL